MKQLKKILASVMVLAMTLMIGVLSAACDSDPAFYNLEGEVDNFQKNGYYGGIMALAEDGTASVVMTGRDLEGTEKREMSHWTQGTWSRNEDGTLTITLQKTADEGGVITLADGNLVGEEVDGKMTVTVIFAIYLEQWDTTMTVEVPLVDAAV